MAYQIVDVVQSTTNDPVTFAETLGNPTIAIEISDDRAYTQKWIRAGYVNAFSPSNIGVIHGAGKLVLFGRNELTLEIPAYPYQVRFRPLQWALAWTLRLYVKDIAGSSGIPTVPLVPDLGNYQRSISYTPTAFGQFQLPAKKGRTKATLYNNSAVSVFIGYSASLNAANAVETLRAGGQWESVDGYAGDVWFSSLEDGVQLFISEFSQVPF